MAYDNNPDQERTNKNSGISFRLKVNYLYEQQTTTTTATRMSHKEKISMSKTTAVMCVMNVRTFLCRPLPNDIVKSSNWSIACEQALYLSLTRDLFWARAAARGLGRGRAGESLLPSLKNFPFHFAWAKRNPIG